MNRRRSGAVSYHVRVRNPQEATMGTTRTGNHFTATLTLSDGTLVGTGFAGTAENARYFAAKDALQHPHPHAATRATFELRLMGALPEGA